jgi:hypothetical protein
MKLDINKISSLEVFIDDMPLERIDFWNRIGLIKGLSHLKINGHTTNYAVLDLDFLKAKKLEKSFGIKWIL